MLAEDVRDFIIKSFQINFRDIVLKIFAVSDIHIDYRENRRWLYDLSTEEYTNDILILAGDVTNKMSQFIKALVALKKRFREVFFVPGNHDLWTHKKNDRNSLDNFQLIKKIADNCGVIMRSVSFDNFTIAPLFSWYDYSFGEPSEKLKDIWLDFTACKWPDNFDALDITKHFLSMNEIPHKQHNIKNKIKSRIENNIEDIDKNKEKEKNKFIISFSHFVPRIDIMPSFIPVEKRILYPVLGTSLLDEQVRRLKSDIHVYGHTHVNNRFTIEDVTYINNAYGYPSEKRITMKKLLCIHEV